MGSITGRSLRPNRRPGQSPSPTTNITHNRTALVRLEKEQLLYKLQVGKFYLVTIESEINTLRPVVVLVGVIISSIRQLINYMSPHVQLQWKDTHLFGSCHQDYNPSQPRDEPLPLAVVYFQYIVDMQLANSSITLGFLSG